MIETIAFADGGERVHINLDAATQQSSYRTEVFMLSMLSLYFAYRRDVVAAERYVAGLNRVEPADHVTPALVEEELRLAA